MSEIKLKNITKKFANVTAVDKVSLDVEEGKFVTLLGPSGCGKTTTLRIIAGLEKPTKGEVYMGGEEVTNLPPYERNIGMVFQNLALFPHLTAFDNIAYGMKVHKRKLTKKEINKKVKELLDLVELPGRGDRYPSQLSGGQQQRIALARALAFDPLVLLLDEPLANLDRKLREYMQVELRRIQKKVGITTLFVTHDQEEAMTMSDSLSVMRNGKIIQSGSPTQIYETPDTLFVASFIGIMNFFECKVGDLNESSLIVKGYDFELHLPKKNQLFEEGQEVILAVRPEAIQFAGSDTYTISGRIDLKRFLGNHVEYHIICGNHGKEVIVTEPAGGKELDEKETVQLLLPEKRSLVFKK